MCTLHHLPNLLYKSKIVPYWEILPPDFETSSEEYVLTYTGVYKTLACLAPIHDPSTKTVNTAHVRTPWGPILPSSLQEMTSPEPLRKVVNAGPSIAGLQTVGSLYQYPAIGSYNI